MIFWGAGMMANVEMQFPNEKMKETKRQRTFQNIPI